MPRAVDLHAERKGHAQSHLTHTNIINYTDTWLLLYVLGCDVVGSTSFLEHWRSSSLLSITLVGVLSSFPLSQTPFSKTLGPAATWYFLNWFWILFFPSQFLLWCLRAQVPKNVDLWILLTVQFEGVQVEVTVRGAFTNWALHGHFPFNSMSLLFCSLAPHRYMTPLPSRVQVFF